jgi:hypothetical protein
MIRHEASGRMVLRGGLRYPGGSLPEIGTVLGPHNGEYVTVVAHEHGRALLSPATGHDFAALQGRPGPRSRAEAGLLSSL